MVRFKITEVISETALRLNLPVKWKIHKVFHGFTTRAIYIGKSRTQSRKSPRYR
jgi:hypothetical protein